LSTLQTSQHSHGNQLDLRTFILGVSNGAVYMAARACIDPEMLLPAFAIQMMAGNVVWVGMISTLFAAGWFWPQIIVARYLETRTHLMPTYLASVVVRCTCAALIPVAVYYWGPARPQLAFVSASLLLFALASAGGFGLVPFMSVVHDAIPARWLGKFFGLRYLFGGLLSFAAGLWIKDTLSADSASTFPSNYALVFAMGAALMIIAAMFFSAVRERPRIPARRALPLRMHLVRAMRMIRDDANMRRLAKSRALYGASAGLSFPFVIPLAIKVLGMPVAAVGLLLSLKVLSYTVTNVLWSHISDTHGNRRQLIVSSAMVLLVPLLTIAAPLFSDTVMFHALALAWTPQLLVIAAACMAVGAAMSGQPLGFNAFLVEILPTRRRMTFLGVFHLMLLPTAAVPLLGALLIGSADRFALGMCLAAVCGIVMVWEILRLHEVREDR